VGILEDLFSLRFNLQINTMYLKQYINSADGVVYEMILVQKNKTEIGSMWIFGSGLFRLIGLSKSQIQTSTIILTNKSVTSTIQILSVATVKLKLTDDSICATNFRR
jgi:hypothetical protein